MDIYKEYDSLYILERNEKKNSSFMRLWPFSWTIAHSYGGFGVIYKVRYT
jgi:hypothetical protein